MNQERYLYDTHYHEPAFCSYAFHLHFRINHFDSLMAHVVKSKQNTVRSHHSQRLAAKLVNKTKKAD